jgi:RNA polymerase sigma factor (sigma-70 family)
LTQLANLVRVEWVMPVYGSLRLPARAREERTFEAMFKRHYAPLLSYCRHMLGDRDEAEDALQQTFIRAHRAMLGGTKPREVRPWLYAIARNCCLSAIAARKPTAPLEDRTPALAGLAGEVSRREDLRELVAGIGRLPEDQRSALLLAELEDLSHQEIAGIVGCPVSKVRALIYQARSALIADRDALGTPCRDIREQLAVARGGELRRGLLRRHLNLCAGCRDFQLAVGAQRQSLAAVLPVLPSAGLATAILGHAAAHTAGAAAGGTGVSASGAAATSTAAGAGASAGSGTGVGTFLGGGLVSKLAVGGTVAALATAGAVAIRYPTHRDRRSIQSGPRHGALRRGAPAGTTQAGAPMLNAGFVQADAGSPGPWAGGSGPGANGSGAGGSGPEANGSGASASELGGTDGSAIAALSPGIAGTVTMPLAKVAPASPAQPARSGGAAGVSGKPSHTDRQRPISKMRRAAQRRLHRQRLRARRRLLKQRRELKRRQTLERRRQLKRRQIAKQRSKRVALPPHPPAATPPAPTPARPPHRHKPHTITTSTNETSSSSSTTTGAPASKTGGRRRTQTTGGPSTGEAEAGTSGTPSTTSSSTSSKHAGTGKPAGASDPGTGAQACAPEATSRANATAQPRGHADGHTHTCPAAQQEEA